MRTPVGTLWHPGLISAASQYIHHIVTDFLIVAPDATLLSEAQQLIRAH